MNFFFFSMSAFFISFFTRTCTDQQGNGFESPGLYFYCSSLNSFRVLNSAVMVEMLVCCNTHKKGTWALSIVI